VSIRVAIGPSSFGESSPAPLQMLARAGVEVKENPFKRRLTEAETIEHLRDVDGLLAGLEPLNRNVFSATAPQLKAVARVGIGVSNVDFAAAAEFGVKVSSTPEAPAEAVAEMTLTALLTLLHKLIPINAAMHEQRWEKTIARSLAGATVLVIGHGRIGARVAKLLDAFGAQVLVNDPAAAPGSLPAGYRAVSLEEGLPLADVITLHAGGDQPILDRPQFEQMRKGTLLLNSARGELVVQSALIVALESGKIGGGWFDAFWEEPYAGKLCDYPQMLLTPHAATYTERCRLSMETQAVENLLRDLGVPIP
jgi:D-3-phosphoglycerate dehydrogenase